MIWDGRVGDLGEGEGLETFQLGRKRVETEDEVTFSCERLRVVLAVLLVVAVCQNTPSEIQSHAGGDPTDVEQPEETMCRGIAQPCFRFFLGRLARRSPPMPIVNKRPTSRQAPNY